MTVDNSVEISDSEAEVLYVINKIGNQFTITDLKAHLKNYKYYPIRKILDSLYSKGILERYKLDKSNGFKCYHYWFY